MDYKNKIFIGDCLQELKKLPDNSIDSVVTDPPYGLSKEPDITEVLTKWLAGEDYKHKGNGFMGKTWDSFVPGPSIWKEVYRVLKPGGHLLCFAGTRTEDLMSIAIRMAGFERRDELEWLYFSGFPKAMDVGKQYDKIKDRSKLEALAEEIKRARKEAGLSLKEVGQLMMEKTNGEYGTWYYRGGHMFFETGLKLPSRPEWEHFKDILPIKPEFYNLYEEAEREKIGESKTKDFSHHKGSMMSKETTDDWSTKTTSIDITAPATPLAQKWDGWKTALKPAHEPILMFRKPLEKNVCYNVEKYGTGALNIDGCRIGRVEGDRVDYGVDGDEGKVTHNIYGERKRVAYKPDDNGRFPANCVTLEDNQFYSKYFNITPAELSKKASKKDRNSDWEGNQLDIKNGHPTVKPVEILAWLIKLTTQPGGIVLDPFAGSGSTLVAAKRHGFNFVGVELSEEYAEIAKKRVGE